MSSGSSTGSTTTKQLSIKNNLRVPSIWPGLAWNPADSIAQGTNHTFLLGLHARAGGIWMGGCVTSGLVCFSQLQQRQQQKAAESSIANSTSLETLETTQGKASRSKRDKNTNSNQAGDWCSFGPVIFPACFPFLCAMQMAADQCLPKRLSSQPSQVAAQCSSAIVCCSLLAVRYPSFIVRCFCCFCCFCCCCFCFCCFCFC
ncbi:hypothetical protein GQ54DRAFT_9913 [Martensiomyces pterosporus]|nr:hypothetical protein GQ54DRAFT_9913 [Martensiomyces pterosporus]